MSADELILWLREYTATRINSHLIDERRCIPPYIVLDFGNRGLLGLRVPRRYGGLELTQSDTVRVLQQLGGIDLTLATFLSTHANGVYTIQKYGCAPLQDELLPKFASGREISAFALTEPCAGSNPQAIETQATKHGQGGWVLNGEKYLVDSGSWASVITVFARTSGKEQKDSNLSAFAVRQGTPGLVIGGESLTMGLRGMIQNTLSLRDVHVAPESLLGVVGAGNAIIQDTLSLARLNLSAKSIGGIKRCLQLLHRYASRRLISTGIHWDNPVTRSRVTQLVSAATTVEALVRRMASALDAGEDVPTEAFLACKVAGSEYLCKAADTLVQALGGRGYVETNVASQILRDARSFLLSEGPTETLLMYLGSRVLAAGYELERFIAVALGAPHIAHQLREIAEQVRARCSQQAAVERVAQPNRSYWAAWLMGEVAMWAILVAAVENSDVKGHTLAHAWAHSQLDERIAALTKNALEEMATGSGRAEEELIASYAESIGDVEQSLPGAVQDLDDLLLAKNKSASVLPHDLAGNLQEYPKDVCIHQLFERQVERTPERLAVVCAGDSLSYRELNARADGLARKLRQNGVYSGALVGLCVDRSLDLLVSLLGILKAGGAYVPLEPTHPQRRLAQILNETRMSFIVADSHLVVLLPEHNAKIVSPKACKEVEPFEPEDVYVGASAEQRAYVMYTSGSTGTPKGVEVNHRSVVNLLYAMRTWPGFSENDVLVAVTTISFDIAGLELLLPIVTGGRVVLATDRTRIDGVELAKLIDECCATVLQATPTTWQMLLASGWQGRSSLKALCGGESLPRELARSLQTRTASLWNLYGPTETTIWSCIEKVTDESGPMTIGRPIANTQVHILNEDFEPVAAGVTGEIFIGGDGVAQGYWQRHDLTAERFLPDPFLPGARMYRTGDLARFLPDGRIEYLGRLDHQVKIRGFRVELGEIEAALQAHNEVRQIVVLARSYAPGDTRLIAYVTLSPGLPKGALIRELQRHVRDRIPAYMLPSAFVVLDSFPLTPNGKIDRNALPAPPSEEVVHQRHEEGSAASVEKEVERIWLKVLRISTLDREDDFFVLGGHSLLATQVVSQLRESFGVEIPIAVMFERPTVAALTQAVCDALVIAEETMSLTVRRVGSYEEIDLSSLQQRLWFLNQLNPSSAQYHVPVALTLVGSLHVEILRNVFEQLMERHDALRARFESRDGRPFQVIDPPGSWSLPVVDLESIPEELRKAELERLTWQEATRPFDLSRGSLLRTMLLRLAPDEHVLLLTAHHIVADGWSMELLLRELGMSYAAMFEGRASPLVPLSLQYADCLLKQQRSLPGTLIEQDLAFWRKQLADLPVLDLPTDHSLPCEESDRGATQSFSLLPRLSEALLRIGRKQGATTFVTLMAALQALLWRYTGQEDFGIGFPTANRVPAEAEKLVGCFVNTLVLRADVSGDPTFTQLLTRVRTNALQSYSHQAVPYELQVQEFRRPLFRVMLALQNAPAANITLPGIHIMPMEIATKIAKFDLTFSLREVEGKLLGNVEYSTDLFESFTIERMIGHFQVMLNGIVTNPDLRISEIPMLTDVEKHQLIVQWNDTKAPYPKNKCMHELFQEQVDRTPDAIAVVFEDQQLSYRELNARANRLARYLVRLGVGPEVLVGICVECSIEMIVGLLGILKAGGAYVPLDPDYPKERLGFMLEDAQVSVLLTQQQVLDRLPEHKVQIVCMDKDREQIVQESDLNPITEVKCQDLAYVIYTSGTAGTPKGVMIEHRSLVNYLCWFNESPLAKTMQSLPVVTRPTFDASLKQLFAPLLRGAQVWILSDEVVSQPAALVDALITRNRVGLNCVPSLWRAVLDDLNPDRATVVTNFLSSLFLGGERLDQHLVDRTFAAIPDIEIWNLYGPTEATANACTGMVRLHSALTIGRPIANTELYILDGNLQPVPIGVPGELHVGGNGLARGYLNRPELTAEKFIDHSFNGEPTRRLYKTGDRARYLPDGNIEFLGRIDNQVKIRGYRIELGEIEAVLGQHPGIREAVVLAREDNPGDKRLIAYIVSAQQWTPTNNELRSYLREKLPEYMVPSAFVFMDSVPLTPNGKVDRSGLPLPELVQRGEFVAPRTPVEEKIAEIWAEVLRVDKVGVDDNFFDLGGHSLLATQTVSRMRTFFNYDIPLRSLFEAPTVQDLATMIIRQQARQVSETEMERLLDELEEMSSEDAEQGYKDQLTKSE